MKIIETEHWHWSKKEKPILEFDRFYSLVVCERTQTHFFTLDSEFEEYVDDCKKQERNFIYHYIDLDETVDEAVNSWI